MSELLKEAIKLLEESTGYKVDLFEFVSEEGEPEALTKRQQGSKQALQTKGFDDWTKEQYAVCYYLVRYGKQSMPLPYKSMTLEQIANGIGVKKSTLMMNGENVKYILQGQSSLESSSPKSINYVRQFEELSKDKVMQIVNRAFNIQNSQNDLNSKLGDKKRIAVKDLSPEQLKNINFKRLERNMEPITTESLQLIKQLEEATGYKVELNEWFAKGAYKRLVRVLDKAIRTAHALRKTAALYPDDWSGDESKKVAEAIKNVWQTFSKGVGQPKAMTEKEELNEWFAKGAYKRLLGLLNKAARQADRVNLLNAVYPDDFSGDEGKTVLAKLKEVWKIFNNSEAAGGNKTFAADDVNKLSAKPKRVGKPKAAPIEDVNDDVQAA